MSLYYDVLVMKIVKLILVKSEQLSTLNLIMSPAVIVVVQVDNDKS